MITVEKIQKAEHILARLEAEIEEAKAHIKELRAKKERTLHGLRRAIRGDEPELELAFIDVRTGEVVKDDK